MARTKFEPTKESRKFAKRLKEIRDNLTFDEFSEKLYGTKNRKDRLWDIENNRAMPTFAEIYTIHKCYDYPYDYIMGDSVNILVENYPIGNKLDLSDTAINWLNRSKTFNLKYANVINDLLSTEEGLDILKQIAETFYKQPNYFLSNDNQRLVDVKVECTDGSSYDLNIYDVMWHIDMAKLNEKLVWFKEKVVQGKLTKSNVPTLKNTTIEKIDNNL